MSFLPFVTAPYDNFSSSLGAGLFYTSRIVFDEVSTAYKQRLFKIMDAIITYDLEEKAFQVSKHTAVKDGMKALGYLDHFVLTDNEKKKTTYWLPNTTLWEKDGAPAQAKAENIRPPAFAQSTTL